MTKQEVYNNIRYNENLVAQYHREIASLNTKITSRKSLINHLNGQIGELKGRRQKLEEQLGELQRLRTKLQDLRDRFSARQTKRVTGFNKYNSLALGVRFIQSYMDGMRDLLSGQEYRNTYNGITAAIDKVNGQIQSKQREIDSVNSQINTAQRNIDIARNDINSYRNSISQRNGDISYRRGRIRYWNDQLKYAT